MASTNLWFLKAAVGTLLISPQVTDMQFTAVSAEVSEQSWLHSYFNEFWRHNILKDLSLKLNQNRCMQEHFSKKTSRTTHDISVENELFIRNIANLHDEMPHILRGVRTEQSQRYISRTIDVTTFSTWNDSLDFGLVTYGTPDIKYFACSNQQTMMIFSYEISNWWIDTIKPLSSWTYISWLFRTGWFRSKYVNHPFYHQK